MPNKPKRPCNHSNCRNLTNERYCDEHKALHVWVHKDNVVRIRGRKLQRERNRLFNANPLCVECLKVGITRAATQRDHVVPLAFGGTDTDDNIQALCQECHDKKTNKESQRGKYQHKKGVTNGRT